ncbi:hypothetical protein D3C71_962300 [compost metagenome]
MDAALDQHAAGGHADLALVQVDAPGRVGDGQVDIGIVQDDQRVLAAQFQRHLLEVLAGRFAHLATGPGGTGELDHRDVRVAGECGAGGTIAGQHVQQAGRQARQFEQAGDDEATAHRRARIRLEHHRIAQGQRRGDRTHGQVQREIERRDHAHHAQRAATCQVEPARLGRQHFTDAARRQRGRFVQRLGVDLGLEAGLEPGRAALADQPFHDVLVVLLGQLRGATQHLCARVVGGRGPRALRGRGSGGRGGNAGRIGHRDLAQDLAGGRFDHVLGAGAGRPLAVEQLARPQGGGEEFRGCMHLLAPLDEARPHGRLLHMVHPGIGYLPRRTAYWPCAKNAQAPAGKGISSMPGVQLMDSGVHRNGGTTRACGHAPYNRLPSQRHRPP